MRASAWSAPLLVCGLVTGTVLAGAMPATAEAQPAPQPTIRTVPGPDAETGSDLRPRGTPTGRVGAATRSPFAQSTILPPSALPPSAGEPKAPVAPPGR
jgi:hypothetical protein